MSNETVGDRIRVARGRSSRADFAAMVGIGTATLARYESGERAADSDFLAKVCEFANVSADWLLLGKEKAAEYNLEHSERVLIESFRALDTNEKKILLGHLLVGDIPNSSTKDSSNGRQTVRGKGNNGAIQNIHGSVTGDVAARDIVKK